MEEILKQAQKFIQCQSDFDKKLTKQESILLFKQKTIILKIQNIIQAAILQTNVIYLLNLKINDHLPLFLLCQQYFLVFLQSDTDLQRNQILISQTVNLTKKKNLPHSLHKKSFQKLTFNQIFQSIPIQVFLNRKKVMRL